MSENPSSPLLGDSATSNDDIRPNTAHEEQEPQENTPLLLHTSESPRYDGDDEDLIPSPAAESLRSLQDGRTSGKSSKSGLAWPTIIAVVFLGTVAVGIAVFAFFVPAAVEEYAKQSLVIEPTNLSIDSFTPTGVRARIQANFRLDASRVDNEAVRNIGRISTWIAREIESKESKVEVYLPEYGNLLIGTAVIPGVVVSIRNGQTTHIDFLTDLEPGDLSGLRRVANDWLEGKLGELRVQGKADVALMSGFLKLGTQSISESLVFEGNDIPAIPEYNITRLNFREAQLPSGRGGMAADVTLSVVNSFPVRLSIPPLGFDILVPNCASDEPYLSLADATTDAIQIEPYSDVEIHVGGLVQELSNPLVKACPNTDTSPLDLLLGEYVHGQDATIFVRGSNAPSPETPGWVSDIISSVTVPVPFPGRSFDNLVKNFSLTDVHFGLPDPFAAPGSPESNPRVSGVIEVLADLPKEMNFGVNVSKVRATADVFYKGKKLGVLDLKKWQSAKSEKIEGTEETSPAIKIWSQINEAPLNITDEDVFTDVVQDLLFGGNGIVLKVVALVDIKIGTVLGSLIVRDLPGEGMVPVKAISKGGLGDLRPDVYDLQILDSSETSLSFQARVNVTNPTEYTAQIPYLSIHILNNGSVIGVVTTKNFSIVRGNNTNLLVEALWDPLNLGGKKAQKIARDLVSQYISGWNTSLTFRTYNGTIPTQPKLGEALSKFEIEVPAPKLRIPADDDDDDGDRDDTDPDRPRFIKDATFHLFSSTATFTLISPLQQNTIYIERINATAFYNHTEPVGRIEHNLPFRVPPGISQTPRFPVDWSLDGVGYDKVRNALGGGLKLDATATATVRLGAWTEDIWFVGGGIGANVRL